MNIFCIPRIKHKTCKRSLEIRSKDWHAGISCFALTSLLHTPASSGTAPITARHGPLKFSSLQISHEKALDTGASPRHTGFYLHCRECVDDPDLLGDEWGGGGVLFLHCSCVLCIVTLGFNLSLNQKDVLGGFGLWSWIWLEF